MACTGGDLCSSNVDGGVRSGDLTYVSGGITARATGRFLNTVAAVVQDSQSNWTLQNSAGLGVCHLSNNGSDDNITSGEQLTISFDQVVHLTSIGLRSEGHNFTNWSSGATFLLNGVSTLLPQNVGAIALNQTGKVFSFAYGGAHSDQFYLSSMSVSSASVAAVPEPETYALMLAGLGLTGWIARRRRG